MMMSDNNTYLGWSLNNRFHSSYLADNLDELSLDGYWKGFDGSENYQWVMSTKRDTLNYTKMNNVNEYAATGKVFGSTIDKTWIANRIHVTPKWSNTSDYYKVFYPYFEAVMSRNSNVGYQTVKGKDGEIRSRDPIYVLRYSDLKAAIEEAKNVINAYKTDIQNNPGKYTSDSITALVNATNSLLNAKPNKFINDNSSGTTSQGDLGRYVSNYSTAAKSAVAAWNAAKTLQLATYTVTFKNGYTGDTISSANYKYGETPTAPSFQITKHTSGTKHSSVYEWIPAISAVTGNAEYTQNVKSWESCDFSQEQPIKAANCHEQGSKKQTCSVCGNERTVPIAINPNNHVGDEELRDVKAATCTEKGYTGDMYCLGCGNVKTSGSATDALGHDWGEWETIVEPQWNAAGSEKRTCKRDSTHTETRDISATGDHDLPTATATVVIDNVEHDNNSLTTDPEKFYPAKNDKITVKIKAADATSGIKEVYRATSRTLLTPDDVAGKGDGFWTKVNVDENGSATLNKLLYNLNTSDVSYVVYFKIVDNADNVTYVNTPMVVFDVTDPTITLTGNGNSDESKFCLTVNVKVEDTNLKTVTVKGEEKTLENGRFTADLTAGEYTVVATDMTGNTTTKTFTVKATHTGGTATCQHGKNCEICGQGYGDVDLTYHENQTFHKGQAATCTEDGYSDYYTCDACGAIIGKNPIKASGHTESYVSNDDGTHNVVCDVCGDTIETNVACAGSSVVGHKDATCTDPYYYIYECDNCGGTYEVAEPKVPATGHAYYNEATFNWTSKEVDGVTVWTCDKAGFKCIKCDHIEEVAVEPTSVTTDPRCEVAGSVVYTAAATLNYTYSGQSLVAEATSTKTVTLPALEHVWGNASIVWNTAEDGTVSAVARRTCERGCVDDAEATVTSKVTQEATCTTPEETTYTATVEFDGKTYTATDEKTTGPALGHDWSAEYNWNANAETATCEVVLTCGRTGCTESETINASIDDGVTVKENVPAQCEQEGSKTYTVTVTKDGKTFTDDETVVLEALEHNWLNDDAIFDWSTDHKTCTVTRKCANDTENTSSNSQCYDYRRINSHLRRRR